VTAVGWAVVGPEGVEAKSVRQVRCMVKLWADSCGLASNPGDNGLNEGYRLARVRIEVIEGGDDE
jgi:hypothetical protein